MEDNFSTEWWGDGSGGNASDGSGGNASDGSGGNASDGERQMKLCSLACCSPHAARPGSEQAAAWNRGGGVRDPCSKACLNASRRT